MNDRKETMQKPCNAVVAGLSAFILHGLPDGIRNPIKSSAPEIRKESETNEK